MPRKKSRKKRIEPPVEQENVPEEPKVAGAKKSNRSEVEVSEHHDKIVLLKVQKARAKGLFSRSRNKLLGVEEIEDNGQLMEEKRKLEERFKNVYEVLNELIDVYLLVKDAKNVEIVTNELEIIEEENNSIIEHLSKISKPRTSQPIQSIVNERRKSIEESMRALERNFLEQNAVLASELSRMDLDQESQSIQIIRWSANWNFT